jgi:hypothetical protein
MTPAIHQCATVDEHHRISIRVDELSPGQNVEIIVLPESTEKAEATSFWQAVRRIRIDDLPEDYSTQYENTLRDSERQS